MKKRNMLHKEYKFKHIVKFHKAHKPHKPHKPHNLNKNVKVQVQKRLTQKLRKASFTDKALKKNI